MKLYLIYEPIGSDFSTKHVAPLISDNVGDAIGEAIALLDKAFTKRSRNWAIVEFHTCWAEHPR